jgi:3-deoxy-D-manno-octulosonate 8-phosphate phosphatase (KDO 8-P phosphatase)
MTAESGGPPRQGVIRFPDPVRERARGVRLIGLDSDGTLTDRGAMWDTEGREYRRFDIWDGLAMQWAKRVGFQIVVISGRACKAVDHRMADLDVPAYQGIRNKIAVLEELCRDHGLRAAEVAFVGDDLPDLPAMRWCGLPLAVGDAHPMIEKAAVWQSELAGGHGAVRQAIEGILEATGTWSQVMARYGEGQ